MVLNSEPVLLLKPVTDVLGILSVITVALNVRRAVRVEKGDFHSNSELLHENCKKKEEHDTAII